MIHISYQEYDFLIIFKRKCKPCFSWRDRTHSITVKLALNTGLDAVVYSSLVFIHTCTVKKKKRIESLVFPVGYVCYILILKKLFK